MTNGNVLIENPIILYVEHEVVDWKRCGHDKLHMRHYGVTFYYLRVYYMFTFSHIIMLNSIINCCKWNIHQDIYQFYWISYCKLWNLHQFVSFLRKRRPSRGRWYVRLSWVPVGSGLRWWFGGGGPRHRPLPTCICRHRSLTTTTLTHTPTWLQQCPLTRNIALTHIITHPWCRK